jgi:hypothetical protein
VLVKLGSLNLFNSFDLSLSSHTTRAVFPMVEMEWSSPEKKLVEIV